MRERARSGSKKNGSRAYHVPRPGETSTASFPPEGKKNERETIAQGDCPRAGARIKRGFAPAARHYSFLPTIHFSLLSLVFSFFFFIFHSFAISSSSPRVVLPRSGSRTGRDPEHSFPPGRERLGSS